MWTGITQMDLDVKQLLLLQEWNEAKEQLKHWQQKESELRDTLVNRLFAIGKTEGTETLILTGEWKLKVTRKLSYNLSNENDELVHVLQTLPSVITQNLIRWNPDLNLSLFRKLDEPTRNLFTPVLTIKPAKPSLELIAPNANKLHEPNQV
jgi:hypothetical protein